MPAAVLAAFEAAIGEAADFVGATAPNPPVGCTLLDRDLRPLVSAAHERAGTAHAEAAALARARTAGLLDRVAHVVVTLEPCNHTGRTPPCTEAILASPAHTVWVGLIDPNPGVTGGGIARLRAAGRTVHVLDATTDPGAAAPAQACRELIAPFAHRLRTGRPLVVAKQALDRDGGMIPPTGQKTFTSAESLRFAHLLRRQSDAIMTGMGTVIADRPEFTVRHLPDHEGRTRTLAIVSRDGTAPADYLRQASARGFVPLVVRSPEAALDALGAAGALQVLLEAGPTLLGRMRAAGLVDVLAVIRQGAGNDPDQIDILSHAAGEGE